MNLRLLYCLVGGWVCAATLGAADVPLLPPPVAPPGPPGPVHSGEVQVEQQRPGVEITNTTDWLAPITGPARLTFYTTYGEHAAPFQITRVFGVGTGMFKYPDRDGVAHYQRYRTLEQASETAIDYLGKPIHQTQSIRRWFDSVTNEVVRVELAATSGLAPSYFVAELNGRKLALTYRLLPGEDPENPKGGNHTEELTVPPGGFIPLELQFAQRHLLQWDWPVNTARRFTVFVPEEGAFRTWWLERQADEAIDLPNFPKFGALRFRLVAGPAPDQAAYRGWQPTEHLDQAQEFWLNPHTGELLRLRTPGPAGSRPAGAAPGAAEADPERTLTQVTYGSEKPPALEARRVVAPAVPAREQALARLTTQGPLDFALITSQKQVGSVHCEFMDYTPPAEAPAGGGGEGAKPDPAESAKKFLHECRYRSLARLTLTAGSGDRRETAETWYLPDGRVRKMLINGRRTLQDTLAYVQEIFCVGEIFSVQGLHIEQIPDEKKTGVYTDGRKTPWSQAHVRDPNLQVFDTNRIEQFLAISEGFDLVERPDWRTALYQVQSDTPQMTTCHLARLTGPEALAQFSAALKIPSRSDPDRDSYPQRSDIQLVAAQGEPAADPAAADWRSRLHDGQAAFWYLTMAGPSSTLYGYFGADHKLYVLIQRERDGRELRWVRTPAEDKTLGAPASPARPIYPRDW